MKPKYTISFRQGSGMYYACDLSYRNYPYQPISQVVASVKILPREESPSTPEILAKLCDALNSEEIELFNYTR